MLPKALRGIFTSCHCPSLTNPYWFPAGSSFTVLDCVPPCALPLIVLITPIDIGQVEDVFIWKVNVPSVKFCIFLTVPVGVGMPNPNQLPVFAVKDRTFVPSNAVVVLAVR